MDKQESSVIKKALENLIDFISNSAEDLLEKAMFLDSKVGNPEEEEVIEIRKKVRQINELNEEFIQLAEDITEQGMSEELQKEKLEKFITNKNKRYRHS